MKIQIADSELPIMELLWKKSPQTSPQLLSQLNGNNSTNKTLLKRLVDKKMVIAEPITSRSFSYSPAISQKDYQKSTSQNFLDKVFQGSCKKLVLNFIAEDKLTKQDLQELLNIIEEVDK